MWLQYAQLGGTMQTEMFCVRKQYGGVCGSGYAESRNVMQCGSWCMNVLGSTWDQLKVCYSSRR